jgi:hypothetical protein
MAQARAALVDLFVPAHLADSDTLCAAAAEAGLDALVLACDAGDDVPDPAHRAALAERHGVAVHVGRVLTLDDASRLVLLGVEGVPDDLLATFEGLGTPDRVRAAALELGREVQDGTFGAYRVGLRALPQGGVSLTPAPLSPADRAGVVAMTAGTSLLARDLDCEALGEAQVPILAGSGPHATLDVFGRLATALPIAADDAPGLVRALRDGRGFPVEIVRPAGARPPLARAADPFEGRPDEGDGGAERAGRRKRPRRRRGRGGPGGAPAAPEGT